MARDVAQAAFPDQRFSRRQHATLQDAIVQSIEKRFHLVSISADYLVRNGWVNSKSVV